ncbi:uncharacterized protein LOC144870321 [Branchiostoma floridae x Branchiostoma japonicum]
MLPTKLPDFAPHWDPCNICVYKQGGYGRPPKKNFLSKVRVASTLDQLATPEPVRSEPDTTELVMPEAAASQSATSEPATSEPATFETAMSAASLPEQAAKDLQSTLATHEEIVHEASRHGFIHVGTTDAGTLILVKFNNISNIHSSISIQVDINRDRTWQLQVQGKKLSSSSHEYLHEDLPPFLTTKSTCVSFFFYLSHCHVCDGNVGYDALLDARRVEGMDLAIFRDVDGSVAAKEEVGSNIKYSRTIRHVDCQLLLPPNRMSARCDRCTTYGHYLRGAAAKIRDKQGTSISQDVSHDAQIL